jgi:hypothetical protein
VSERFFAVVVIELSHDFPVFWDDFDIRLQHIASTFGEKSHIILFFAYLSSATVRRADIIVAAVGRAEMVKKVTFVSFFFSCFIQLLMTCHIYVSIFIATVSLPIDPSII